MQRYTTLFASILCVLIFVLANLWGQTALAPLRFDTTQQKLYTLSDGTRETLQDLSEPIEISLVYTASVGQEYPAIRAHAARVREMLGSYQAASNGQLRVRLLDPAPFSVEEDEAMATGLTPVQTQGDDPLYFGIIGRNMVDDEHIISFLSPERDVNLEYELTQLIARLNDPLPPVLGVISALGPLSANSSDGQFAIIDDLKNSFDVVPIGQDFTVIPDTIDVLLVAHAANLSERQEWLIDQFLMRKGRAVFLVDPAAKAALLHETLFDINPAKGRSDLGVLGRAWGVSLAEDAVGDTQGALQVNVELSDGRYDVASQPLFFAVDPSQFSRDPMMQGLRLPLNFGAPGALRVGDVQAGLEFTALALTGPAPSFVPARQAARSMDPQRVLEHWQAEASPLILAGRLAGQLETAFPNGAPVIDLPDDPVEAALLQERDLSALTHLSESEQKVEIVIIADVDFLDDGFYLNPNANGVLASNGALVLNALDRLAGSGGNLVRLRTRSPSLRPMTRVNVLRQAAQAEFVVEQARLEDALADSENRLAELRGMAREEGAFSGGAITAAEIESVKAQMYTTRERMRAIERSFRADIDRLEAWLRFLNIWGGVILLCGVGAGAILLKRRRIKRRLRQTETEEAA